MHRIRGVLYGEYGTSYNGPLTLEVSSENLKYRWVGAIIYFSCFYWDSRQGGTQSSDHYETVSLSSYNGPLGVYGVASNEIPPILEMPKRECHTPEPTYETSTQNIPSCVQYGPEPSPPLKPRGVLCTPGGGYLLFFRLRRRHRSNTTAGPAQQTLAWFERDYFSRQSPTPGIYSMQSGVLHVDYQSITGSAWSGGARA